MDICLIIFLLLLKLAVLLPLVIVHEVVEPVITVLVGVSAVLRVLQVRELVVLFPIGSTSTFGEQHCEDTIWVIHQYYPS